MIQNFMIGLLLQYMALKPLVPVALGYSLNPEVILLKLIIISVQIIITLVLMVLRLQSSKMKLMLAIQFLYMYWVILWLV